MTRKLLRLIPVLLVLGFPAPSRAAEPSPPSNPVRVFYASQPGAVMTALELADSITLVDQIDQAQVLVLNGIIPDAEQVASRLKAGAGLVLILGPEIKSGDIEKLTGARVQLQSQDSPLSLINAGGAKDPVLEDIVWNSAPQVRERYQFHSQYISPLIIGYEDKSTILGRIGGAANNRFVFSAFLDRSNPQFQDWAYFNYLIYHLSMQAAGQAPLSFADYPGSPVPHRREQVLLIAVMGCFLTLSGGIFVLVRRYSLRHPELLTELVSDREEFETHQKGTGWEEIGFHRPLAGFLVALMLGLLLFIPLIIYQNLLLPVYILPSAQALGIWGRVVQFFNFLWLFFDLGTSAAFIKFFAEYRVHRPQEAIQYGQVFVWWQALSGAVQVAIFIVLAGTVLPRTAYALYAWSVIIHILIQIPGFYQLFRHALMGWQRFDYAQIIDLGLYAVFPMITQPIIVSLLVLWGRSHPVFGLSMSGLLGLGLAAYASEALAFLFGFWLYRRTGYSARLLFLAHFGWDTIRRAFRFGSFEMLGSVAWAVGQAVEILITQTRLVNYNEVWGNWVLAQNFIFAYQVILNLYSNVMPSVSEAFSNGRRVLSQYYAAMSYKWGGIGSCFIGAVLLAVADRFILGASGPEFVRAASYAAPLIIWGAIQYPSWVGDTIQLACNRPSIKAALVAGEQFIRILLAVLLVARYQIQGLIFAYFAALLLKGFLAYLINGRIFFPQRLYFWQSLAAPVLAGAAHYLVLRWITGLMWKGDQVTSILIFLVGILFSFPLFAFFYGLFGGWDRATLSELRLSAELSGSTRLMSLLFWASSAFGARISPLNNRYPIDIRDDALVEAKSLTKERVNLGTDSGPRDILPSVT